MLLRSASFERRVKEGLLAIVNQTTTVYAKYKGNVTKDTFDVGVQIKENKTMTLSISKFGGEDKRSFRANMSVKPYGYNMYPENIMNAIISSGTMLDMVNKKWKANDTKFTLVKGSLYVFYIGIFKCKCFDGHFRLFLEHRGYEQIYETSGLSAIRNGIAANVPVIVGYTAPPLTFHHMTEEIKKTYFHILTRMSSINEEFRFYK